MVQFCDDTLAVLKQFAKIDPSLYVSEGNILRAVSTGEDYFAKAVIPETFEHEFGFYDLNQFINCVGLFDKPNLEFGDRKVVINDDSSTNELSYFYSDIDLIKQPPSDDLNLDGAVGEFDITSDELKKLQQSAAVLGATELCIESVGEEVRVSVLAEDNSSEHTFGTITANSAVNKPFNIRIKVEYMWIKLFKHKGHCSVYDIGSENGALKVETTSSQVDLTYWMAGKYEG